MGSKSSYQMFRIESRLFTACYKVNRSSYFMFSHWLFPHQRWMQQVGRLCVTSGTSHHSHLSPASRKQVLMYLSSPRRGVSRPLEVVSLRITRPSAASAVRSSFWSREPSLLSRWLWERDCCHWQLSGGWLIVSEELLCCGVISRFNDTIALMCGAAGLGQQEGGGCC